eukprot:scaffold9775_cov90-Isochrysis_galbana.AAC.1
MLGGAEAFRGFRHGPRFESILSMLGGAEAFRGRAQVAHRDDQAQGGGSEVGGAKRAERRVCRLSGNDCQ